MKTLWLKMSFRKKILYSFLLTIILLSSIFLVIASDLHSVNQLSTSLVKEHLPQMLWINHWKKEISTRITFLELWQEHDLDTIREIFRTTQKVAEQEQGIVSLFDVLPAPDSSLGLIIEQTEELSNYMLTAFVDLESKESMDRQVIPPLLAQLRFLDQELDKVYDDVLALLKTQSNHMNLLIKIILWTLLLGSTTALILALYFSYRISSDLTKPIDEVTARVKEISEGNYGLQLVHSPQLELGKLIQSINQMSTSLEESFHTLFKEKQFREEIMASIPVGIVTVNDQENEFHVNETAKQIIHLEEETWSKILYKGMICKRNVEFWTWFQSKEFFSMRKITIKNTINHASRKVLVSQSPLKDQEDHTIGRIFYFVDVSQIDSLEQRIYRSEKLALVGELAAGSAHEIRNPLAVIKGFIQILESEVEEEQRDRFQLPLVLKELDRINNIVENMLLLAKPGAPNLKKCNFEQDVLEGIMPLIHASSIDEVNIHIDIEPFEIFVDPEQMKQVIYNLIRNSKEAIEGAGDIYIYNEIEQEQVALYFKDTGRGIPPYRIKDIFEPFMSTKDTGTGLGLTIIQRIVENHHGEIELVETSAQGTTFKILLPLHK